MMGIDDPVSAFERECRDEVVRQGANDRLRSLSSAWFQEANAGKYSYHFSAFGRPVIQYPQDMVAVQELIWAIRPTLIIETGIAHGGSIAMSAGMLALLDYADAVKANEVLDPHASRRRVIGVDIDIRPHNRRELDKHPMRHKMELIEGSSINPAVIAAVRDHWREDDTVLVMLDSNHTHDHVLAELHAYAPLTSRGSYCVVFDTVIEELPSGSFPTRPWDKGDNPQTALEEYIASLDAAPTNGADGQKLRLEVDHSIDHRLLITVAPGGYLRRLPG